MNAQREKTATMVVDIRTIRCDGCKVAIHNDLAIKCPVCGSRFDSIASNHVGLAAKLRTKRAKAGV